MGTPSTRLLTIVVQEEFVVVDLADMKTKYYSRINKSHNNHFRDELPT